LFAAHLSYQHSTGEYGAMATSTIDSTTDYVLVPDSACARRVCCLVASTMARHAYLLPTDEDNWQEQLQSFYAWGRDQTSFILGLYIHY